MEGGMYAASTLISNGEGNEKAKIKKCGKKPSAK